MGKTNDTAVCNTPKERREGYNDKIRSLKVRIIDCVKITKKLKGLVVFEKKNDIWDKAKHYMIG